MTETFLQSVLFACSVVICAVVAMDEAVYAAGDSVKGKSIYQGKCIICHGPQGKGDGPLGPQLKPPAVDFTKAGSKKKSADELRSIIENGKLNTAMMAWKSQLAASEIDDVLAYVLTLRQ